MIPAHLEATARDFSWNAEHGFANSSALYQHLARQVAGDPDILEIASQAQAGQIVSNMLFGAAHYLLMGGLDHPLRAYFTDLTPSPRLAEESYPYFRAFCLEYSRAILPLLKSRWLQTNEVRRCSSLLLAFDLLARRVDQPLALIEIGPSAGLNLLWDRYGYAYGAGLKVGDSAAPVQIRTELRGEDHPLIPKHMPDVAYRVGVDLNPIDVNDPEAVAWLRALIWPEQIERGTLLSAAIEVARYHPLRLLAGDALEILPGLLEECPTGAAVCVFHSFVLNQFPKENRLALDDLLIATSQNRPAYRVSLEWLEGEFPLLELFSYEDGVMQHEPLAVCDHHGRWIQWGHING
jgi:hypothetical protein